MYFGQLIIGPGGSGKSTFCKSLHDNPHLSHKVHIINLDPSNEQLLYCPLVDICDLVSTQDVVEELALGPNGGLVYCFQYLVQHFYHFLELLQETLQPDDYVLFDCPGQLELYTHLNIFKQLIQQLENQAGFRLAVVYMMDVQMLGDYPKFVGGMLMATTAMLQLGLPHATVLNKCDLLQDEAVIEQYQERFYYQQEYQDNTFQQFYQQTNNNNNNNKYVSPLDQKLQKMTEVLRDIVVSHDLVSVYNLNQTKEESLTNLLFIMDNNLAYHDSRPPDDSIYNKLDAQL